MKYRIDESKMHERTEKIKGKAEMTREYGMKKTKTAKRKNAKGEKMPFA